MKSNFDFIKDSWLEIYESAKQAENKVFAEPRTSIFYSRRTLELAVFWMYGHDSYLRKPYQENLSAMVNEPTFQDNLVPGLFKKIEFIRRFGNHAVHSRMKITDENSLIAIRCLYSFLSWFAKSYSENIPSINNFDESLLTKQPKKDKSNEEVLKLYEKYKTKDKELKEKLKLVNEQQEVIEQLQAQVLINKEKNQKFIPEDEYTEEETRDLFIDLMLREAGWNPEDENCREYEVEGMPNETELGYADYVLWGDDGLPLAVLEAKKTKLDPRVGQRQAELYANCLEAEFKQRPVIFYTNGYITWFWDDKNYPPREVQGFYTKDELQLVINRRSTKKNLLEFKVDKNIAGRSYQEEAIKRVLESYQSDSKRKALLVMATGTGKTRVSIALADILTKANWAKNILFLADRNALLTQSKKRFNEFLPHVSLTDLRTSNNSDSRIVFSTYPAMMNSIDEEKKDGKRKFSAGHFDLIIIDEAHRSIYQKYRAIFEYFDALLLGLTATPKDEVDRNTYRLFELEDDVPTFAYELDRAVQDGYLVPYKTIEVPVKFLTDGINYDELSEEEKEEYELTFEEEDGALPPGILPSQLNDWVFNENTVDQVLKTLFEYGIKVQDGDKLGKTIIFAKNHSHAEFIKQRFDINFPQYKGNFARVIDNYVNYAQSLIDDFSEKEKEPTIAISVDMLDTGIDVPEIVNLVFFKIVRSKAKFWQMIGRGTRTCIDLFRPNQDKDSFHILDFCSNFEFFGKEPEGIKPSRQETLSQTIFKRRLELAIELQATEYQEDIDLLKVYNSVLDILHKNIDSLNVNSFIVRPYRTYIDKFKSRKRWNKLTKSDVAELGYEVSHLINPIDDDELARRFDLLVIKAQLTLITKVTSIDTSISRLRDVALALSKKANIPVISKQIDIIKIMLEEDYWKNINVSEFEKIRVKLRELIKFLDKGKTKESVFTDFKDALGEVVISKSALIDSVYDLQNYKLKVEKYIRENQNHVTIHKIKHNIQITSKDIKALEQILFDKEKFGTKETYEKAFEGKKLGELIRNIVGLDRKAAKEAFSDVLNEVNLTSNQIRFIDEIINYLTKNGVIEPDKLYEPPFIDIHNYGVSGVFDNDNVTKIVKIIKQVNNNSVSLVG